MSKNAQVTLFIILGIVVLVSFALVFYLAKVGVLAQLLRLDITEVENYIEESLKFSAEYCLNKIGVQGGYYIPQNYLEKQFSNIEYAYSFQDNFLSSDNLKTEIENCIQENMLACINDFKDFKRRGYKIEYGNLEPEIVLAAEDMPVSANFDVNIKIKDNSYDFNTFKANNIIVRLKQIHNITATITTLRATQIKSSDFDLSYLGSVDVNSSIYEEENSQQVYYLVDPKSTIENKNYFFLFSNKFEK